MATPLQAHPLLYIEFSLSKGQELTNRARGTSDAGPDRTHVRRGPGSPQSRTVCAGEPRTLTNKRGAQLPVARAGLEQMGRVSQAT